jgi:NADPH-dependent 2,4-dienoyl-CoA reductase/sulfur reductase-like enzyme
MCARSLSPNGWINGSTSRARFDKVVIATGSRSTTVSFPGSKKPGVHVLGDSTAYLELAARRDSIESLVVSGSGIAPFEVAEMLNKQGRRVTVLGRASTPAGLCRELGELLEIRAVQTGIKISRTRLQKAVGSGQLEAVVAGGRILPCDTLAVVPSLCPGFPPGSPERGPQGGISVDDSMRSTDASVFAAGSCAEMTTEGLLPVSLCNSASASGRVAGANAAGRNVTLGVANTLSADLFGLHIEGAGLTLDLARRSGQEVVETVVADGATSVCSLVHDRATGRLVGGQIASESCEGLCRLIASAVSRRVDVGSLAYADLGNSTDISVLQDTARQGLAWR